VCFPATPTLHRVSERPPLRAFGAATSFDFATVYDPATGAELWVKRYNGPNDLDDAAHAVAVSPDGSRVFVTGYSSGPHPSPFMDYATVAYDGATGQRLWARRYDGPASERDDASSVALSPDGATVFVTGESTGSASGFDFATIAYDASTGSELWVKRYKGPDNGFDDAGGLGVSPDSTLVFVTGGSTSDASGYDYATIAYEVSTGAKQWARRYDSPTGSDDSARALAVSADGTRVFVSGVSISATGYD
jgi:DNA-binding beta-propeller fold protein YncE